MGGEAVLGFVFIVKLVAIGCLFGVAFNENLAKQTQSLYLGIIELVLCATNAFLAFAIKDGAFVIIGLLLVLMWAIFATINFAVALKTKPQNKK